jgi:hypothetical protein
LKQAAGGGNGWRLIGRVIRHGEAALSLRGTKQSLRDRTTAKIATALRASQ